MAVLKDLIVHGPSRFLNTAYFNTLQANKVGAEEGIFNKLIATNADIATLNVEDLTAQNAKVVGILDVTKGELLTNKWTNANIANIDGSFYISPTVATEYAEGNSTPIMTITIGGSEGHRSITVSDGNFATDAAKYYDGNNIQTADWSVNSRVMVTGNIRVGADGVDYPLGTCVGYITSALTSTGFTVGEISSPSLENLILELNTTTFNSRNITISMYEIGDPADATILKPVGIMLTSYGRNNSTYMDIYGGVNVKDGTGNITPNVRIGFLGNGTNDYGLPQIGGDSPKGWGIYTDNGYFRGTVVANSGRIGSGENAWNIGNDVDTEKAMIYTGNRGEPNSAYMSTGVGVESIGGSDVLQPDTDGQWAFTAGANFGVTTKGALYANSAHIAGAVHMESGTIDYGVTIGQADSVHISLSQEQIGFWRGSEDNDINKTAYITNQYMYIPYTVVLNEMQVGTKPKYETVENPSGNPSEQKWYELINGEYVLTTDTNLYVKTEDVAIDETKTYYVLNEGNFEVVDNPVIEDIGNYYEITSKIYYVKEETPLWSWRKMDSGNLRLMWLGGEV